MQPATTDRPSQLATRHNTGPRRQHVRLAATFIVAGEIVSFAIGMFHPGHQDPNNHPAVFFEYANSSTWVAVHLGQFVGMTIVLAGLYLLVSVISAESGALKVMARLGSAGAGVALALYAVLQAVDGVALKRAVDAWMTAPGAEKAARFASAEAVRWLEEAVRSYQSFAFGLTLVLIGMLLVGAARVPAAAGVLMGLSGLAYIVQGSVLGVEGFGAALIAPQLIGYALIISSSVWLLVTALRMKEYPTDQPGFGYGARGSDALGPAS